MKKKLLFCEIVKLLMESPLKKNKDKEKTPKCKPNSYRKPYKRK